MLPTIAFQPGKEKRLAQGYLWAFRNELEFKQKDHAPGSLVAVATSKGRPLGTGFLNTQSNLCFRLLALPHEARHASNEAGALALLLKRLEEAFALRQAMLPRSEAHRLVNSEGDLLSGLVVDLYGDVLVVQFNSLAMDQRREAILDKLKALTSCRAIVERSESAARQKEGLEARSGLLWSEGSLSGEDLVRHSVSENGLKFTLNLLEGQKTGFYLDQRETRAWLRGAASGKDCLDVFCHSGGLALSMAKGGAKSVLGIDESELALELAAANAKKNKLQADFEKADAFKALRSMSERAMRYDLVLLDPPAMAKQRAEAGDALRGYKELNLRALKLLNPGGLLVSCSCTQLVSEEELGQVVQSAAVDALARIQEVGRFGQPLDHPRHPAMPETRYLKVLIYRKL